MGKVSVQTSQPRDADVLSFAGGPAGSHRSTWPNAENHGLVAGGVSVVDADEGGTAPLDTVFCDMKRASYVTQTSWKRRRPEGGEQARLPVAGRQEGLSTERPQERPQGRPRGRLMLRAALRLTGGLVCTRLCPRSCRLRGQSTGSILKIQSMFQGDLRRQVG